MADFAKAFDRTMRYEGGYVNDPDDRGGETYRGIARKVHPTWPGWITVDNLKFVKMSLDDNLQLQEEVEDFYRKEYWDRIRGDVLPDSLAMEIFDCAVNCGVGTAVKFLQRALNVKDDGGLGPVTLKAAVDDPAHDVLVVSMKQQRRNRYERIVANDPSQAKFLKGWLRRADESVA